VQLSEQDRQKLETELTELNGHKQRLLVQHEQSLARIRQLHRQRDQALKNRNAAALLQAFNLSLHEQQSMLASLDEALNEVAQKKQALLSRFAEVYRTQHVYKRIHDKQQRWQYRKDEGAVQRRLDDLIGARASIAAS